MSTEYVECKGCGNPFAEHYMNHDYSGSWCDPCYTRHDARSKELAESLGFSQGIGREIDIPDISSVRVVATFICEYNGQPAVNYSFTAAGSKKILMNLCFARFDDMKWHSSEVASMRQAELEAWIIKTAKELADKIANQTPPQPPNVTELHLSPKPVGSALSARTAHVEISDAPFREWARLAQQAQDALAAVFGNK